MRVLVTAKRCVDYAIKIRVKNDKSGIETNNIKHSLNPFDEIAIEESVRLKELKKVSEIVALTIGPSKSQEVLRTALALGADSGIHIQTDKSVDQQLQPLEIAKIIEKVLQKESEQQRHYSLIMMGKQSIDDDFVQTPQLLASLMSIPVANFASKVRILDNNDVEVEREIDGGLQTVWMKMPAIISCDLRLNVPRFATLPNIMKAKKKDIVTIQLDSLLQFNSGLTVLNTDNPPVRKSGVIVQNVDELIHKLRNEAKVI